MMSHSIQLTLFLSTEISFSHCIQTTETTSSSETISFSMKIVNEGGKKNTLYEMNNNDGN